jgi:hypothetical protein
MDKKSINKIKKKILVFLVLIFFSLNFLIYPFEARADASILVYSLMTPDTTPIIKGTVTVSDPKASVFVIVDGYESKSATVSDDGSWSLQFDETLAEGTYAVGAAAEEDGEIVTDVAFLYVDEEFPIELFFEINFEIEGELSVESFGYTDEYAYDSDDGNFSFTFPAGTVVTKTGGGNFDLTDWQDNGVDPDNARIISQLRFGVSDIGLDFSEEVTVTFIVGEEYNGRTLNIFTRSEGSEEDGWEPMDLSCVVADGRCSFGTSHASFFGVSEFTSLADGDEDEDEDESEEAYTSSWKAYRYEKKDSESCKDRLRLVIKGKHFDEDAKVRIGDKKAYSVDRKSSKKIVAKFCVRDLLKVKTSKKRVIKVINPGADTEEADKKIDLNRI